MTTTAHDLADSFRRLVAALAWLEDQPDGAERAQGIRARLAAHFGEVCDGLAGKTAKCLVHPRMLAHNCPACRSERIGRPDEGDRDA